MIVATQARRPELTAYEKKQVRRIAEWKSKPPHPLSEFWKRISLPPAKAFERLIPDSMVRAAIERSYDASTLIEGQAEIRRRAGVDDLEVLRRGPLERCDALAGGVKVTAESISAVEGGVTGVGGLFTSLLDVPLLFVLSLGTIRRVGHCYGYPLEGHRGKNYVLGVLIAAMAGSLEVRRQRVRELHELEDLMIEDAEQDVLTEEALSFIFQLEFFEEVPGVGLVTGAAFNWSFIRRVANTARMVFQERWLRDNGKVEAIEPAEAHERSVEGGWSGLIGRAVYSGCYGVSFGVALPVYAVAAWIGPMDNALVRGLRDGATEAGRQADHLVGRISDARESSANGRKLAAPATS